MPMLQPRRRPSTATITIVPSARWPIAVRGSCPCSCTGVNASPALKIGRPSLTSVGPALTASVTPDHSVGSGMRTVSAPDGTASARNCAAAVPRATRTAPSDGIEMLPLASTLVTVPVRSLRGAAGGNGSRTTIVPRANGVFDPHTGVKSATESLRAGSFSWATGFQIASAPCQRPYHGTRSACSVAVVSMPTAARPSADWCSTTPARMSSPLGQPPFQLKKSPLTPIVVICADASRSISETVSRPTIVPFESSGISLYSPWGFGAVTTYITIGPAVVQRKTRSYVTPGITCVGRPAAGGVRISATGAAAKSLRDIRPRFTVAETAAFLLLAGLFFTTPGGGAAVPRHDRPVPILMYHVIAAAPAGVAFPDLFVRPADFKGQMSWLAQHGYHAVTLHRVYDYWRNGSPLPPRPIVVSFEIGRASWRESWWVA